VDIVIVGGPHSGVGKTLAAEIAVRTLAENKVGAIKLTVADGERDPTHDHGGSALAVADAAGICGRGMSCGVCETVSTRVPSRLITSTGAIRKPNTDTRRLSDAGAVAVAWIITLREAAPQAVDKAIAHLESLGANTVLIEGTTALDWLLPRASVMVATDPGRRWKEVALRRVRSCDIVLRNRMPTPPGDIPAPSDFFVADPLSCNLADSADAGTIAYVRRLRTLCGVSELPASASSAGREVR
jgi:molybdopterin-guanine dinucleotide biosynthesis protein